MPVTTHDIIETLNDLIETCEDGKAGYKVAAEGTGDLNMKEIFMNYADQREHFIEELQKLVAKFSEKHDDDMEDSGSMAGTLHRGWINIKQVITGSDIKEILDECERGEDVAVDSYNEALEENLPGDIKQVVKNQYKEIKKAHDHINVLRESFREQAA